ncbi:MAG: hypothetical protein NUV53_01570 [Patescibacteria group bacterium]|nr:hypothetical protein [Patescibacteria group bacterium]
MSVRVKDLNPGMKVLNGRTKKVGTVRGHPQHPKRLFLPVPVLHVAVRYRASGGKWSYRSWHINNVNVVKAVK